MSGQNGIGRRQISIGPKLLQLRGNPHRAQPIVAALRYFYGIDQLELNLSSLERFPC
jgi:hypothetical protein